VRRIELVASDSRSQIIFGFDWREVETMVPATNAVIITDHNVKALWEKNFPSLPVLSITPGESSKSLSTIDTLVREMLELGIDRDGFVLGIGGGVVCDIAGFTASVYMRGIRFGFVSSTLLSQVDASTGGKNGVNCSLAKNVIGLFNQPEFVICDESILKTLSDEEYLSGLSELVKTAFIGDSSLIDEIGANMEKLLLRDESLLRELIFRSVQIKSRIVGSDMREAGVRRILNFGHTFGHAAEMEYGIRHGVAVAWGMVAAIDFSVKSGYLTPGDSQYLKDIIFRLGLLQDTKPDGSRIARHLGKDKKRSGEDMLFVFLGSPGVAKVDRVSISVLMEFIGSYK
jgi:3-dehydroquinate synthase